MILIEPTPEQRRRDARLAWTIVGCSAAATLILLVIGIWALSGTIARKAQGFAATNDSMPTTEPTNEAGKASVDPDDRGGSVDGDDDELPPVAGEVRKRSADAQDGEDSASVRRGERPREAAPARRPGPIA